MAARAHARSYSSGVFTFQSMTPAGSKVATTSGPTTATRSSSKSAWTGERARRHPGVDRVAHAAIVRRAQRVKPIFRPRHHHIDLGRAVERPVEDVGEERPRQKRQVACHNEQHLDGAAGEMVQRRLEARERTEAGMEVGDVRQARGLSRPGRRTADQEDVGHERRQDVDLSFEDGAAANRERALVGPAQAGAAAARENRRRRDRSGGRRRGHRLGLDWSGLCWPGLAPAKRRRTARYVTRK